MLASLLDNAVKFSPSGAIRLALHTEQDTPDSTVWRLRVTDEGIGIAAGDQHRIFTLFEQVDGSTTRSFEGAGLGLALCKRLVEGMGGSLGAESEPDPPVQRAPSGCSSTGWSSRVRAPLCQAKR